MKTVAFIGTGNMGGALARAAARSGAAERLLILCNFHGEPLPCPLAAEREGMTLLISNYQGPSETLRPYEARMYLSSLSERRD